mmetsp:Transcript_28754/g.61721  ORF Transcript_28754/g.61721 Transcript_28754/m.61721 type:complete len:394 (-) Transcript_28754:422-1603(-)|eukprot:CAMPEP_0201118248 /NCGR_PEP_ID=MMETSP0850-20130426/2377_1 /ASSEMBLY_ACC=CAM_ASM_000622 /TAXON_ID=183588 /ORGANISM="Pseudo-nitzschia fraudulenta, Strain WWA7" /LENGTH=393 /DNA_ID=CAMNT_0047383297 /DNA_START=77 /DNA_END=1258 /DNA_ORIENTATION=-
MFSSSFVRSSARVATRIGRRVESTAAKAAEPAKAAAPEAPSGGMGMAMPLALISLGAAGYVYADSQSKVAAMSAEVGSLQKELSGKTNSAFVFIKPHACKGTPGSVESVVEGKFKDSGIRVTDKGEISAEEIDSKMFIDTHYGAIASKAVKLQPSELNVPDKGKKQFEAAFGESWDSAIASGKVYNAKDGAAKLGLDSEGVNAEWSKLTRGKDLIKFGGGFYCGKVKDIYVMNGFYMSMRAAYCNPGEKIQWYTVSWPTDSLSWEDFRGQVLGATDPSEAPKGSIRRSILDEYKKLGLKSKPNTGDNGVHASASPFEALAERNNWLGKSVEEDSYGKGLIAAGVPLETIAKWSGDSQVSVEGETKDGKTMSVFDTLEDLDADTILAKVSKISK